MEAYRTDPESSVESEPALKIADGIDLILLSEDEALIQFGSRSEPSQLIRDPTMSGVLGGMLGSLLQGPRSLSQVLAAVRPEHVGTARKLSEDLFSRGILTRESVSPVEQYLRYTFTGESHLTASSVSILGAGPLGARVAHSLLQHGIRRLVLLDDRKTDSTWQDFSPFVTNNGNSAGYAHVALCGALAEISNDVSTATGGLDVDGIQAAVSASELTIVAFERPHLYATHLVNRLCVASNKPWILACIDGNIGTVGPLFLPTETACYNCYATLSESPRASRDMARRYRQYLLQRGAGPFFLGLPCYADIVSGYTTLAVVHHLLGKGSFALGRVLLMNFERMVLDVEDVLKLPRCPVCSLERSPYKPPFPPDVMGEA